MRADADSQRVRDFARALGRAAPAGARLYLIGGATAVVEGWRPSTIDIDVYLEPDSDPLLRRISELKEEMDVNVELASPLDFIPELPGWRERSPFLFREGALDVHHFDPYAQALSKVERGFATDLEDVAAMLARGMIERDQTRALFEQIEPMLFRYPAIDPSSFRARLEAALAEGGA
jgi:hypothetical protein